MIEITMPQAGQTMEEGTILCWRKNEGDEVRKGEILLEIETDKATIEVEASESGILGKILCPAGETVPVHTPIAIITAPGAETGAAASAAKSGPVETEGIQTTPGHARAEKPVGPAPPAAAPEAAVEAVLPAPPGEIRASPAARKAARERGIELGSAGPGSGPDGRILSADVVRAGMEAHALSPDSPVRRPLTGMRRAIARNLLVSKQNIPHFYMRITIDAGPLLALCRSEKERCSCTLNDLLTAACARVIREFPAFRTRLENDELVEFPGANIGMAVGTEDGLRVPVLVGAERLSLRQISEQSRRIIDAARHGKVEAMGQGVFTISNLGMYGIEEFAAIINPPESALLAVAAVRESVIVKDGALRAGRVMTMTLSADHRVIDGLLAARFLNRLKAELESPEALAN